MGLRSTLNLIGPTSSSTLTWVLFPILRIWALCAGFDCAHVLKAGRLFGEVVVDLGIGQMHT